MMVFWLSVQWNLDRQRPVRRQKHPQDSLLRYNYDVISSFFKLVLSV